MSYTTPVFADIRQTILNDWTSLNPQWATAFDSDNYIRASGFASAVEGLYAHQQWAVRQQFPDTADSEYLKYHAALRKITRRAPSTAAGVLRVSGTVAAGVPAGTAFTVGAQSYATTAAGVVGAGGTVDVAAQATVPGLASNLAANTAAVLTSAPAGTQSAALVVMMDSGSDIEGDTSLLARYLSVLQQPPQGGSKADWKRWALEVPGVVNAYVYPLRSGVGTVDVCITSSTGVPSAALIQVVIDHLEPIRPVGFEAYTIFGPTMLPVPVTAVLVLAPGYTLATVTAAITTALQAYFATLAPKDVVYRSKIESIISDVPGVLDRTLTSPAANVMPASTVNLVEQAKLGAVVLTT